MAKKGLGKGLDALIPAGEGEEEIREVELERVRPGKSQSRKIFDAEKLAELAQSIRENGLLQPIVVREAEKGRYEIIAGERRWRACQMAGVKKITVIVRSYSEQAATTASLIENIQRENLNPLEEAEAYQVLMKRFGMTQEEISRRVGKSRPFISNMLRLLNLPPDIKEMVREGLLTAGHARALLILEGEEEQKNLAQEIVRKGLSVRETEKVVQELERRKEETRIQEEEKEKSAIKNNVQMFAESEKKLKEVYGTEVRISYLRTGKGRIIIRFKNEDNLKDILERLLR
ncbi:MAG: ParB/RepB/Spo0J family partition protein [Desulfotomaculales bacterium]